MKRGTWRAMRMAGLLPLVIGLWVFLSSMPASVKAAAWQVGDVFVGLDSGAYNVYDNDGNFKETINSGLGYAGTGAAFNPDLDKLYTTNFFSSKVSVFDIVHPHAILQTIQTGSGDVESIVFDNAGNFYVGHADGYRDIEKYDSSGNLLDTYDVPTQNRGSDWIELASDQTTMFYTSEGTRILRYDLSTKTSLPDFGSTSGPYNFALRLLPPGDGSGGLLVAAWYDIEHLDGAGNVVQTYDVNGEDSWFALNLDPNGTSFWSGGIFTGNFYRFNIATGAIEVGPISTGAQVSGICVAGEITVAKGESIQLTPLSATNPLGTLHTVYARAQDGDGNPLAGVVVTFTVVSGPHAGVTGNDTTNVDGEASFIYTGTGSTTGTDTIEASFVNSENETITSNQVTKTWEEAIGGCNLKAHYPLDEGSGNIAGDASGNGNDGNIIGAEWTIGKIGGGLSFDGVDDYVTIPVINSDEVSVSAWFYKNAVDTEHYDGIFGGYYWDKDIQLREGFCLKFYPSDPHILRFILVTQDAAGNRVQKTVRFDLCNSVSNWHHVVGTYEQVTGKQKLFVNGVLVNSRKHPAGNTVVPLTLHTEMLIGQSGPKGYFDGTIDDVRLYCRPLSDQEVLDIYNQ